VAIVVLGAAALFASTTAGSRVGSSIRIHRPISDVFAFFTTPKNWPLWHPASISVAGATDHSLEIGEEVTEEFRAGDEKGTAVWRVTARDAPRLWRIEATPGKSRVAITYRLRTEGEDTVFERDMQYHFGGLWFALLDPFVIRPRMERESAQAVANAKEILER
jgi:uncharacterized protein YndB with AHSA1/START domain